MAEKDNKFVTLVEMYRRLLTDINFVVVFCKITLLRFVLSRLRACK